MQTGTSESDRRTPVVLSWSGGKDSALALDALQRNENYEVVALLTTFTRDFNRVSMHGIRRELIIAQADRLQLPLIESWITRGAGNDEYEAAMIATLEQIKGRGISTIAFGDLFLEDIKSYRDKLVSRVGMTPIYPIWGFDTTQLACDFVNRGFRAMTCCVDTQQLPAEFCGRIIDHEFLGQLPETVDPCGENGEFHSFVFDSPGMSFPIEIETAEIHRDGQFIFQEIMLAADKALPAGVI